MLASILRCRLYLLLPFLVCIAAALGGAAARADDAAQTILAKHYAFTGWKLGDGTFKTLRLESEFTNAKGVVTERSVDRRIGLLYRNSNTYPRRANTTDEAGFTGNVFWRTDFNGFTNPLYGDLAKFRLAVTALLNEGLPSADATIVAHSTEDGKSVAVLHVPLPSAFAVNLSIDETTGALVTAVIDPGGDFETTFHILSYAEPLPGKKIIGSYRTGDSTGSTTYTKIEPNVTISNEDLHPPPATATWTFADGKPFPISLTPTRIIVHAKVNGVDGTFMLDTGASGIFLNQQYANRAGATDMRVHNHAMTLYDPAPIDLQRVDRFQIGDNTLTNVIVNTTDFNNTFADRNYRGLDGKNYDGLIGYDLFAGAIVHFDPVAQTMTLNDPASFDPSAEKGLPLIVDIAGDTPSVPMMLNNSIPVIAHFDSGDPDTVVFGPDLIFKYHLTFGTKAQGSIAGYGSIACGTLDKLTLGPIVYASIDACERKTDVLSGRNILVGLDFLRHFDITFDYPHGRLFLQPAHQ